MTEKQKLEAIKAEIERRKKLCGQYQELSARKAELECIEIYILTLPDEQSEDCDTCTNDKGCVACENGELHEGKPTDYTKNNKEKAKTIAKRYEDYWAQEAPDVEGAVYESVMEMAEWKDRQFKQDLDNAFKSADHVQYTNGYNDALEKACKWLDKMSLNSCFINLFKKEIAEGEE